MTSEDIEKAKRELSGTDSDICLLLAHLIEIARILETNKESPDQ